MMDQTKFALLNAKGKTKIVIGYILGKYVDVVGLHIVQQLDYWKGTFSRVLMGDQYISQKTSKARYILNTV